jgi:hypothetical protein
VKTYHNKEVFALEFGFSSWLFTSLTQERVIEDLKKAFPCLWQFIVYMVYCRVAFQCPLKRDNQAIPYSSLENIELK